MDNCADFNMVPSENGNRCECPRGFHFELDIVFLDILFFELNIEKLKHQIPSNRPTSSTTGTANTAGTGKAATETYPTTTAAD